jgi:hypothetical protein
MNARLVNTQYQALLQAQAKDLGSLAAECHCILQTRPKSLSKHRHPAIHMQRLAGDITGII